MVSTTTRGRLDGTRQPEPMLSDLTETFRTTEEGHLLKLDRLSAIRSSHGMSEDLQPLAPSTTPVENNHRAAAESAQPLFGSPYKPVNTDGPPSI